VRLTSPCPRAEGVKRESARPHDSATSRSRASGKSLKSLTSSTRPRMLEVDGAVSAPVQVRCIAFPCTEPLIDSVRKAWASRAQEKTMAKIGRNDSCPCGSGKKYKKCCLQHQPAPPSATDSSLSDVEADGDRIWPRQSRGTVTRISSQTGIADFRGVTHSRALRGCPERIESPDMDDETDGHRRS
jgi:hypothetical protein